jgi:hypothetical protein
LRIWQTMAATPLRKQRYRATKTRAGKATRIPNERNTEATVSDRQAGNDPALDRPDRVDAIIEFLTPTIDDILQRLEGEEFTTPEFIELLQTDPVAKAAFDEALRRWGEGDRYARMVIHGQVIPGILRRSALVEWLGFAYDVQDPYAVPARWRLTDNREQRQS